MSDLGYVNLIIDKDHAAHWIYRGAPSFMADHEWEEKRKLSPVTHFTLSKSS